MSTVLDPLPPEGKARLLKLIEFLKTLPPEKFNFGLVFQKMECGSVGCAIGWTPEVFPELVEYVSDGIHPGDGYFRIRRKGHLLCSCYWEVASTLFGMRGITAQSLFQPDEQKEVHSELPNCDGQSHPSQVAAMLEQYLTLTETPS